MLGGRSQREPQTVFTRDGTPDSDPRLRGWPESEVLGAVARSLLPTTRNHQKVVPIRRRPVAHMGRQSADPTCASPRPDGSASTHLVHQVAEEPGPLHAG